MNDNQQVFSEGGAQAMLPVGLDSRPAALIHADPAAVAAAEMAREQIKLAYFMAVQSPRNQREAWQRILEACKRPTFAQKAIYSKPVDGSKIEGPSIRLAEAIIREWRNIIIRTSIVYEDESARRVSILVIDLESNLQLCREIVTPKTVERKNLNGRKALGERRNTIGERVFIVAATEDEMSNRESAAISKIVRNEGLRLIPADVVEDAIAEARRTRKQAAAQDPDFAIKRLVYMFGELRVDVADLERYLGGAIGKATADQIDELEGILQAIRDRETTWSSVMELRDASDPSTATKTATEQRAEGLKSRLDTAKASGDSKTTKAAGDAGGRTGGKRSATAGAAGDASAAPSTGNGGNSERPAAPAAQQQQAAGQDPPPPDDRNDPGDRKKAMEQASGPHGETAEDHLADDPDRQFAAVGFAVVDLPDLSIAELAAHANRIKDKMDAGEKRTLRPALESGNAPAAISVLARVARREAVK